MKIFSEIKMNLGKLAIISILYTVFSSFIVLYENAILTSPYSMGASQLYKANTQLLINILIGLFAGIFGGSLLIFVNSKYFRRKSFKHTMLTTAVGYILIFVIITLGITAVISWNISSNHREYFETLKRSLEFIVTPNLFIYFIMWGTITLFTLFMLQVNDKFGPGILLKFIRGKYHHPKKEQRIFLFSDMRSSTTIAEKLGNEKYFNLLNDVYSDITEAILVNKGEIYQYVGDEIVITWPLIRGVQDGNCINCFLEIQQKLIDMGSIYMDKYGLIPEMKAGIHHGQVMAGEIGMVKKEIIYSGDVLNTTARIQESCNKYNVDMLISKETFDLIQNPEIYELKTLGSIELRGKERKVDLNTIKMT
ncbi:MULTISPECIES: adenylate/guanylate cyclase domain-containing protein [unclassified Saccharicrinis]|uniref:adenylate/guanylate cyclase domain-containing protein n=1 Tax=unclassified Saccharicrinis TaxID=2646859 RepID=UPI003D35648F